MIYKSLNIQQVYNRVDCHCVISEGGLREGGEKGGRKENDDMKEKGDKLRKEKGLSVSV